MGGITHNIFNPILHGRHKVPVLISKICIFAMNTAGATKFGEFRLDLEIRAIPIKPLPWQPLFQNPLLTILT